MMKSFYRILFYTLTIVCLVGCADNYVETSGLTPSLVGRYLNVEQTSLSFGPYSATQKLGVKSNNVPWSLSTTSDWVSLATMSGQSSSDVSVSVIENETYSTSGRSTFLTLKSTDNETVISRAIAVNQESPALILSVSSNTVSLLGSSCTESITVLCNTEWTFSATEHDWLSVTQDGDKLIFSADENPTGAERTAYVSVKSGSKDQTITVTQKVAVFSVSPQELNFGPESSSQTINIDSEVSWAASSSVSNTWFTLSPTTGQAGSSSITVKVEKNTSEAPRQGVFTINGNVINVNQEPFNTSLIVTPSCVSFNGSASEATVKVTCNADWSFQSNADWLTVKKTSDGLLLSAKENSGTEKRTTYINITSGSKNTSVEVSQLPASLSGLKSPIEFSYESGSQTFSMYSEASWKVNNSYSWISVTPNNGNAGSVSLKVQVTENASREKREGSFTINNKTFSVIQDGVNLSVLPTALSFGDRKETQAIQITSNTPWTLKPTESWIQLSNTKGQGNATVYVTLSDNDNSVRSGQIILESSTGIKENISVSQSGKGYITINTLSKFVSEGGSIEIDPIEPSSWTAKVEDGVDWIHLNPSFGSASAKTTITVDPTTVVGERTSYVEIFYNNGMTYHMIISQYGLVLKVGTTSYSFFAKGGTSEAIHMESDGVVVAQSSDSWLKPVISGSLLTLTADENLTGASRTAIVTLTVEGTSVSAEIKVTQAAQHGNISVSGYDDDELLVDQDMGNGHEYVDLGLSVKWATMNVGATEVAGSKFNSHTGQLDCYGEYYAWGETSPKETYNWSTYKWCNGTYNTQTKYCTSSSYGTVDNKTTLELYDDAVRANWGGAWRMPTYAEQTELRSNCYWEWTTSYNNSGVKGYIIYKVKSDSDKGKKKYSGSTTTTSASYSLSDTHIFLPASGYRYEGGFLDVGSHGYYWSSSLESDDSYLAFVLYFSSGGVFWGNYTRYCAPNLRAVCQ